MTANRQLGQLVPLPSVAGQFVRDQATNAWVQVTKTMTGLGNVDNTSDANKPVSTAQQTALDLKAPVAAPAFTGNGTITGSFAAGPDSPLRMIGGLGASFQHLKSATGGQLDVDDVPFTNTDQSLFRYNRNISTSGNVQVAYHRGNGSTAVDHSFKCAGTNAATTSEAILSAGGGKAAIGASAVDATATLLVGGAVSANGPVKPGQYTLTTLPSASTYNGYEIDVTNATGGSKRCRSNGTVWQILNTTTTVS